VKSSIPFTTLSLLDYPERHIALGAVSPTTRISHNPISHNPISHNTVADCGWWFDHIEAIAYSGNVVDMLTDPKNASGK
jgi:hypothetical protein